MRVLQALLQGVNPQLVQFLDIRIRRERVLEDALNQIVGRPHELKKPLRVTFVSQGVDEEGLDQGGVKKEFFQLLTREIFNQVRMASLGPVGGSWSGSPLCHC